jgi:hypothetical protein
MTTIRRNTGYCLRTPVLSTPWRRQLPGLAEIERAVRDRVVPVELQREVAEPVDVLGEIQDEP